jgi:hypothetical protein
MSTTLSVYQEAGWNWIVIIFIICMYCLLNIMLVWRREVYAACVPRAGHIESAYTTLVKNVQGRHHLESPRHKWDANNIKIGLKGGGIKVWIELMWLLRRTSGGPLWTWQWTIISVRVLWVVFYGGTAASGPGPHYRGSTITVISTHRTG